MGGVRRGVWDGVREGTHGRFQRARDELFGGHDLALE